MPYLPTAAVGIVLINAMSMHSAGFTAQALGFASPPTWAIGMNAAISLLPGSLLMMVATSFPGFVHPLSDLARRDVLGVDRRMWIGVFGVDQLRGRSYDAALLDTRPAGAYWCTGGFAVPATKTPLLHVSEDPERTWGRHGGHFLHEARTYASWQSKDVRSAVRSAATTVAELRDEEVYRIVTPEQLVALDADSLVLYPLCVGMPVEEGWRGLRLFCEAISG